MPKRIQLQEHLSTGELERRYRGSRDPVERSHYQIIWLLSTGRSTSEVMEVTGYGRRWVQELARRYNQHGAEGLGDRRHHNPGGAERVLLVPQLREELGEALLSPPPDGGMWSGRKVAEWIEERIGRRVKPQRGWEYLRALGYTPQVPRPTHALADRAAQEEFKGN